MIRICSSYPNLLLTVLLAMLLASCQKAELTLPAGDEPAIVETWRFPCGPTCDAAAWVLVMQNGEAYEVPNLPSDYQQEDQPVLVQYRKTGTKSSFNPGTGLEIISILKIRPR